MKKQIIRVLINTLAFFLAAQFLPIAAATPLHFLGAGIILALINLFIRPLLILLAIPFNLLTLGVFSLYFYQCYCFCAFSTAFSPFS